MLSEYDFNHDIHIQMNFATHNGKKCCDICVSLLFRFEKFTYFLCERNTTVKTNICQMARKTLISDDVKHRRNASIFGTRRFLLTFSASPPLNTSERPIQA